MTHFYRQDVHFIAVNICGVSMPSRADDSFLRLMARWYQQGKRVCQCPLGLMTHFYFVGTEHGDIHIIVSMPSRADDSFLRLLG